MGQVLAVETGSVGVELVQCEDLELRDLHDDTLRDGLRNIYFII